MSLKIIYSEEICDKCGGSFWCIGYKKAVKALAAGEAPETMTEHARLGYDAIMNAPMIGSWKVILNLPAFFIVMIITGLAYIGIKESKKSTNLMVPPEIVTS